MMFLTWDSSLWGKECGGAWESNQEGGISSGECLSSGQSPWATGA